MTNTTALPTWSETIRQKYLAGEASVFVLHGNVFDRYLHAQTPHSLISFLHEVLLKENKKRIVQFSIDQGVRYLQGDPPEKRQQLYQQLENKNLPEVMDGLERFLREGQSNAILIPYANALFPAAETSSLSMEERVSFTALHRWSLDETLFENDNIIILITESLTELNPALLSNPKVSTIEIPIPDFVSREATIGFYAPKFSSAQIKLLATHTAGMRSIPIASIVAEQGVGFSESERLKFIQNLLSDTPHAEERAAKLTQITAGMIPDEIRKLINPSAVLPTDDSEAEMLEVVRARKREIIEKECSGLIEFIEPKYGLDMVGGNEHIKHELRQIAASIKSTDASRAPMGILAVGAMGAGKTFVIKAFLKEAGLSGVVLKNFRSKWVGATESNLERVLATVRAMGPIAVIIDESDRSFGSTGDSDGGTSSRVIARLKEFMSDTENRGKVIFIMMTNRPDKLDTDIKRPGRLDKKIPFFYPQTATERAEILQIIIRRYGADVNLTPNIWQAHCEQIDEYSNADLEALALLCIEMAEQGNTPITEDIVRRAVADFMPPQERDMINYMNMLAVQETSRRSLLPKRYQSLSGAEVLNEINQLRQKIFR